MSGHGWRRGLRAWAPVVAIAALLGVAGQAQAQVRLHCNGQASLCDRPLNRVVLAATHNSMSAASKGFALPNQPLGIAAQLKAGVHGFLIDVHYGHPRADGVVVTDPVKTAASRVYLCHELCEIGATPLVQGLRTMRKRLDRGRGDVLVLDVEDYVSTADLAQEFRRAGLDRYAYRGAPGPQWPTLRQMIAARQQVVVLTEHRADGVPWIHLDYAGIVQETPYTLGDAEPADEPGELGRELRPEPRRHHRVAVPAQPLVAAAGSGAGDVGARQRGRRARGPGGDLRPHPRRAAEPRRGRLVHGGGAGARGAHPERDRRPPVPCARRTLSEGR